MKPIKLKMSAFGPYADVETVDFSAFDGKGLFLITGTTGAGRQQFSTQSALHFSAKQAVLHETAKCSAVICKTAHTHLC